MKRQKNATPWVDRTLTNIWDRLEEIAPGDAMPIPGNRGFEEFGCGHYGCALPTELDNVVLKLTTDESEARLVAFLLSDEARDIRQEGIVQYYSVVQVEGASYRRRPLYAIWREEALSVGTDKFEGEWVRQLIDFKLIADIVRSYVNPGKKGDLTRLEKVLDLQNWARNAAEYGVLSRGSSWDRQGYRPYGSWHNNPYRSAWALQQCEWLAQSMGSTPEAYLIGEALEDLLATGILLADVHTNNVGTVEREDYYKPIWVITDPGHALVINPEFEFPGIEIV